MGRASTGKRLRSAGIRWSEAIAVGRLPFVVERVKNDLGIKAMHREDGTRRWNLCAARAQ